METDKLEELLKNANVLHEMASTRRISPELVPIVAEALKKEVKYLYAVEIDDGDGYTDVVLTEEFPRLYGLFGSDRPWVNVDYGKAIVVAFDHKSRWELREYLEKHKKFDGFRRGYPGQDKRGFVTLYRLLERHPDDPFGRGGGM